MIKLIIKQDADVYTVDDTTDDAADTSTEDASKSAKLLLRFRKNKLTKTHVDAFYENIIKFAQNKTGNRGASSGAKIKNVYTNPRVMTNIIGYFDKLAVYQKYKYKMLKIPLPKITARATRFLSEEPEKFKKTVPLIEDIDACYKKYIPDKYEKQKRKASQTPFRIANTSFTTVTTNVNYQTAIHTDKGDDEEGFGNLAVIEHGSYEGGETCFPQYGIGVDVRTGDILFMDVHQPHSNLPIQLKTPESKRLSIVCYLRRDLWKQTQGKTRKFMLNHVKSIDNITKRFLARGPNPSKK